MSRAFRKEDDDKPERPPSRPVTDRPNLVTENGLKLLQQALEKAREENDARNIEYFEERVSSAEVHKAGDGKKGVVGFGSAVRAHDDSGTKIELRIVGEDEADPVHGTISWISPYAEALMGHRRGDKVVVQRPAGPATVLIDSVEP